MEDGHRAYHQASVTNKTGRSRTLWRRSWEMWRKEIDARTRTSGKVRQRCRGLRSTWLQGRKDELVEAQSLREASGRKGSRAFRVWTLGLREKGIRVQDSWI